MMQHNYFIGIPFYENSLLINAQNRDQIIKKVLVNAVGFGGNAVSVLLSL